MGNPVFARFFNRVAGKDEERGQAELRRELLAKMPGPPLSDRVLEVGPGNGLNFPHYPETVTEVVAAEPEPFLRARAEEAARTAPVEIRVVDGAADRLTSDDSAFDAVVVSGVLCSVPDQQAALTEFRRVLKPGGELRFYEHVRSRSALRRFQDAADLVWPRLMGGCHPNRDTLGAIRDAGFQVTHCRGLIFPPGAKISVVSPRVLGSARR